MNNPVWYRLVDAVTGKLIRDMQAINGVVPVKGEIIVTSATEVYKVHSRWHDYRDIPPGSGAHISVQVDRVTML